jgi:hypothetical protein
MRNCLILGSGRSGTSLAAGTLARAGYFMGDALWPENEGNPKGQFEDQEVNGINEDLLGEIVPLPSDGWLRKLRLRTHPMREGQRWLAALPLRATIPCPPYLATRIEVVTARTPFCFKDPRFSYTLPAWRPYLKDTLLLCVFRHPSVTAASMLKEIERADYLRDLKMDAAQLLEVWDSIYRHVLEIHYPRGGDWLFVHYDQLLEGTAYSTIEERLGVRLDPEFADRRLKRSEAATAAPARALELYRRLCDLAGYPEGGAERAESHPSA